MTTEATTTTEAPAMPESFSSIREAANFLSAERERDENPAASADTDTTPDADADTGAAGDHELSDEGNADPVEPAHGEDADADPEAEKLPPVERPRSWAKDEQAEWEGLPRSLQEKIAAREVAREKTLRQSQNVSAEQTKGLTAKEQAAEQAKANFEQRAREALEVLERHNQANFADIKTVADVSNLAVADPLRFVQWQAHQTELAAMKEAVANADKAKADKASTDWRTFRAKEDAAALEHIPDLADKVKGPALMTKAVELLQEIGFSAEDLGKYDKGEKLSLFDHRVQRVLFDAICYRDLQAAKKAAVAKSVPHVVRPGARQPTGTANSERIKALQTAFNNNPTLKNAAALTEAQRRAPQRRAA